MTLDLVVQELADRLWEEEALDAALGLQAVAATETEESDRAWNILVETLMDGEGEASIKAGEALAYYTTGGEEQVDEVLDVYLEALHSPSLDTRKAAFEGLNLAADLSPEVRGRKTEFMRRVLMHDADIHLEPP